LQIVLRWDTAARAADAVQARFDAIADTLPHGLLFIDDDGSYAWVNQEAAHLRGVPSGTVAANTIAQAMAQLRRQSDVPLARAEAAQIAANRDAILTDLRWTLRDEPARILSVSTAPVKTRRKRGRLWLLMEITAQEAAQVALKETNANLIVARQRAESSNSAKSQFLANMSHELRTPLNAIIGLTDMMVANAPRFGTEKALEPLRRVHRAGTHLLGPK
jgi:two-component system cell cycle sensor histidine kinase PleC